MIDKPAKKDYYTPDIVKSSERIGDKMKKYVAPEADFIVFEGQLVTLSPSCPADFCNEKEYQCGTYNCPSLYGNTCGGPNGHTICTSVTCDGYN